MYMLLWDLFSLIAKKLPPMYKLNELRYNKFDQLNQLPEKY